MLLLCLVAVQLPAAGNVFASKYARPLNLNRNCAIFSLLLFMLVRLLPAATGGLT
jgi:hypothetical protein